MVAPCALWGGSGGDCGGGGGGGSGHHSWLITRTNGKKKVSITKLGHF